MYHDVAAAIENLCAELASAHACGVPAEELRTLVAPARQVFSHSPFVTRLQLWPNGYPGDFETVEHLLRQESTATPETLGYYIERYCLATPIAQQHRNKVQQQALAISETVATGDESTPPRILLIACGGAPDVRLVMRSLATRRFLLVLNDQDDNALVHALSAIACPRAEIVSVPGNVFRSIRKLRQFGPFDLVVAGGLFDYLDNRWASSLAKTVVQELLTTGGRFLFTNIAEGNPYRLWMECIADWHLFHRTEQDVQELFRETGVPLRLSLSRDATNLTLMCDVNRIAGAAAV